MSDLYPQPIDAAQLYAEQGWRVAPVSPGSKVPSISEWQKRATTDASTIVEWWAGKPTSLGVCIVTGRETGLWVLDVDVAGGKQGLESLRELVAENGSLPQTIVARTPSGGYHYYFEYPDGVDVYNSASNRLGPGLDVRGEGGQVNAPPTARESGGYKWADGRAPWSADVLPAPAWLLDLVKERPKPQRIITAGSSAGPVHSPTAALAVRAGIEATSTAPAFVTDYNASTTWPELLTSDDWTPCETHGDVDYWTRPGKECRDGVSASTNYGESDLLYVWSTSIDWLPSDRAYDRYGYMTHRDHGGDFDAAAKQFVGERREAAAKGDDLVDLFAPFLSVPVPSLALDLLHDTPNTGENEAEPEAISKFESALMRLDLPDFWNNDPAEKDFLVEPFLARGRAHALYASAKAGKSYVALQAIAAACVPGHSSWASVPDDLVKVLYLDYEMTEDDLRERLRIFGYGADDDYSRLRYVKASLLGADLDTKEGGRELTEQAIAWGVDLVVVDTMSRAVMGDENDADTVRKFYQHTGRLLKAHDIAWLRIDHAGKDGTKGQRGSSAKNDDVDIVWQLERLDNGAKLTRTHSRVFWIADEILLENVAHADGSVHHVRSHDIGQLQGLTAKAKDWLRLEIPLTVSKRSLRDEWQFRFTDGELPALRERVRQLAAEAESAAMVPGVVRDLFSSEPPNRGQGESGSVPGPIYKGPDEPRSPVSDEGLRRLRIEAGIIDHKETT